MMDKLNGCIFLLKMINLRKIYYLDNASADLKKNGQQACLQ